MGVYTKDQLIALVQDYAYGIGFDPAVAVEQMRRESANFREDVVYGPFVGASGERGVSQFTPGTWDRFGYGPHSNAYDPDYALSAWAAYMTFLLNRYDWDYTKALQGYNGGEGNVDRGTVSTAARTYAREILAKAPSSPDIVTVAGGQSSPTPWSESQESKVVMAILIGAAILGALLLLKD